MDKKDKKVETDQIVYFLSTLNPAKLETYSDSIICMYMIFHFVIKLIKKGAFIPQIVKLGKFEYIIRWIPALLDKNVKNIFEKLIKTLPKDIVKDLKKPVYITPEEQIMMII